MSRRELIRSMGVGLGIAAILGACKAASSTGVSAPSNERHPALQDEPGQLKVFDWAGYGDGYYYSAEERRYLWEAYTRATGDVPRFILYEDDDAAFAKASIGETYDIVHPTSPYYTDYVHLGLAQPWDTALISNYRDLRPSLEQIGVIDGQQYLIIEDWGFGAPMYRADLVTPTEPSWSLLFDERFGGRISWTDSLYMLVVAAILHGISDPWDMTDDELSEMRDFLISKRPLVRFLWGQSAELFRAFKQEEVWIGYSWPDAYAYANGAGLDVVYMEPMEGRLTWAAGFGLSAGTQNYRHAHAYVDSWSSVKAAQFLLTYYNYGHANENLDLTRISKDVVDALSLDDPSILEPPRSHPVRYVPRRLTYEAHWAEVKAA